MLNIKKNFFKFILFIVIFIIAFFQLRSYATLHYELTVINSSVPYLKGQIYFSKDGHYSSLYKKNFTIKNGSYNKNYKFDIKLLKQPIKYIRFDPLLDKGEVILKNVYITNSKNKIDIDLTKLNKNTFHNIKIVSEKKNLLHIKTTGSDPYFQIVGNQQVTYHKNSIYEIIGIAIFSFIILYTILYLLKLFKNNRNKLSLILTTVILVIYTITIIVVTPYRQIFSNIMLISFPIIGFAIIYINWSKEYMAYIKNIFTLLGILTLIVLISDFVNDKDRIYNYLSFLPYIISALILPIAFIQKKSFNYKFYKNMLTILVVFLSLITLLIHLGVIDKHIAIYPFGYEFNIKIYPIGQKNYAFWHLILMWATISFYNYKNRKDLLIIILILTISGFSLLTGYSLSGRVAFKLSVAIYIVFVIFKFSKNILLKLPILLASYIILAPFWAYFFSTLHHVNPRLTIRCNIFKIAAYMIKEQPIFGYGFDTTNSLPLKKYLEPSLIEHYLSLYIPHCVPTLLWLNFGLLGAIFFAIISYKGMKKVVNITYNKYNQASIFALIVSFIFIITFNWSAWWAPSFLTYSFFVSMILLSLNQNSNSTIKS